MRDDSIPLHPEYGLNPAMDCCLYCGKERGVALLGNKCKGKAPRQVVSSLEPCNECKEKFGDDMILVGVDEKEINKQNIVPTCFIGVSKEFFTEMLRDASVPENEIQAGIENRVACMPDITVRQIIDMAVESEKHRSN